MKGYYKRPEQTAQAIDSEGWLHTSDIGMILPNGTLKIIDRKLVNYLITFFYVLILFLTYMLFIYIAN